MFTDLFNRQARMSRQRQRMLQLKDMLRSIPTGRMLMTFAEQRKLGFHFDKKVRGLGSCLNGHLVKINPRCPKHLQAAVLAHEIRHAWQDANGLSLRNQTNVRENIINTRFCEADAYTIEAQVAWELAVFGVNPKAWRAYKKKNRALAKRYEEIVARDELPEVGKAAMQAVFSKWFEISHKFEADYRSIFNSSAQLERRAKGLRSTVELDKPAVDRKSPSFLLRFGVFADGENYLEGLNVTNPYYLAEPTGSNLKRLNRLEERFSL